MIGSPEQAMQTGLAHHRAGRYAEAEAIYREVLDANPDNIDALHLLGVLAHQVNRDDVSEELIRRAIAIAPLVPDFYNSLGQTVQSIGRTGEAIECFFRTIALEPEFADAYANLGIARRRQGEMPQAQSALREAANLSPGNWHVRMLLGGVCMDMGDDAGAVEAFTAAAQIDPASAESHMRLAVALQHQGRTEAAASEARRATQLRPDLPDTHRYFGAVLAEQGRHEEAIAAFEQALRLRPSDADALCGLGTSLLAKNRGAEAVAALQRSVDLRADSPQAWLNLGAAHKALKRIPHAAAAFARAIKLKPDFTEAHNNFGHCLMLIDRVDEAHAALSKAIELDPQFAQAHSNLGIVLHKQGRHLEAIAAYRRALSLRPQMPMAHQNILLAMNYEPQFDAQTVFDEHLAWAAAHTPAIPPVVARGHDRDPERRLRIGYVSGDFRRHVISYFMEPLLTAHDRSSVEVFCYSTVTEPDEVTERLRGLADEWRDVATLSDAELMARIQADRIDILVDLAGHQTPNRLSLFARKPAPVQATYLGYPNTTGLTAMDYRLTDHWADPPGANDRFYTEKLWRLPRCAWCFAPTPAAPDIEALPADAAGHITFGSLNKFTKFSPPLLSAWAKLLAELPDARLIIKSLQLRDDSTRRSLDEKLTEHGIPLDRCEILGPIKEQSAHLDTYNRIDIALDAYPYHGTTTTCEALYMGVPVITLAGDRHVSRVGVSLLNAVGMPELIADSWDDYIVKAAALARDRDRLRGLRSSLRPRVQQSPLMDGPDLARTIESAYRQMWRQWCAK